MKSGLLPLLLFIASAATFYFNPLLAYYLLAVSFYARYEERNS